MEYVARVVNTEYHKTCFLLNAYNRLVSDGDHQQPLDDQ